ncbi:MAG: hypothetical protein NT067_03560 [Candidatus Diapherotrites archaeon]|nr:hypothetical protein [Candidatus Diapherotrites archaeon]
MKFLAFLEGAFHVLKSNPKLFVPNIIMGIYDGILQLMVAGLAIAAVGLQSMGPEAMLGSAEISSLLSQTLLALALTIAGFFLNVLVWGMYPAMVKDYSAKKKVSFSAALKVALDRFLLVSASAIVSLIVPGAILYVLISNLFLLYGTALFWPLLAFALAVCFATFFLFYLPFSAAVLGKKSLRTVFAESFSLTKKNPGAISKASAIPFVLSMADFGLAFLAENAAFLAAFWALKLLLSVVVTYSYVLNPTIYMGLKGELVERK